MNDEKYRLVSQMRRVAVSVPANMAERLKRRGQADKIRFYNISEASLEELKYYFILSKDLGYTSNEKELMSQAETVSRMLYRLIESINRPKPNIPISGIGLPVCYLLFTVYFLPTYEY